MHDELPLTVNPRLQFGWQVDQDAGVPEQSPMGPFAEAVVASLDFAWQVAAVRVAVVHDELPLKGYPEVQGGWQFKELHVIVCNSILNCTISELALAKVRHFVHALLKLSH